jgi:peptide/nickel transport system substrate-binding protein
MQLSGASMAGAALGMRLPVGTALVGAQNELVERVIIDLVSEPSNLDPATTYDANSWSVVHSIYDSLLQHGDDGSIQPLLAETFELVDPLTYQVVLRPGITFHDGEPLTSAAVTRAVAHIQDPETASQIAGNFMVIEEVVEVDELTAQLKLSAPAPWLPAQIAAWLLPLPEGFTPESLREAPHGTGPYRFVEWRAGERIRLEANPDYFPESVKGQPIAQEADFRFVVDATTRVSDLLSNGAQIIRSVPVDQVGAIEASDATVLRIPIAGSAFVTLPTDIEPFSDVRVRQALNYAIDVEAIVDALLEGEGMRLANLFVPGGLGYDPNLEPYRYDPDQARALLEEAGYPDGFETVMDYSASERSDIVEVVAAQLRDVGVDVHLIMRETAVFNAPEYWSGTADDAADMRFLSWRPLFDPYTALSLLVSETGFLSRHSNPTIQELYEAFAVETDSEARAAIAIELGEAMHQEPSSIYLYSLTSFVGQAAGAPEWSPRPDDYVLPTLRNL